MADRQGGHAPGMNPVLAWGLPLLGVVSALMAPLLLRAGMTLVEQNLDAFGMELPALSRWILRAWPLAWLAPLAVPATWLLWPWRGQRPMAAMLAGMLTGLVVYMVVSAAIYLPVMQLSETL